MEGTKYLAFDDLIEGVQVIDRNWRYLYVNNALLRYARFEKDELLGYTMMEKYPKIEQTEMFVSLKRCMEERVSEQFVNPFDFVDGSKGWFELSIQPVPEGVLILSNDITRQKIVELELAEKLAERSRMVSQIQEQKRQLEEFCQIIAHNMRGPLSNMQMLNDMMVESNDASERELLLSKQETVVNLLNEVFDELIDAIQVKMDYSVERTKFDLNSCLEKAKGMLQGEIIDSEAHIKTDFSEIGEVYFSRMYMDSIIFNLLSNALKYSSPQRRPEISLRSYIESGWIWLEVEDNGLGIDLEKHGYKLFKLRKTFHDHPRAKGFGLFITKTQLEALGGNITAESTPGVGTKFILRICKTS